MAVEKIDPLHADLTMPIVVFVVVGIIHILVALLDKKNIKQTLGLLLKTEMLVLPIFASELLPSLLKGNFDYEEAISIKAKLSTFIFLLGEVLVFIPIVRKVKEQQRIVNDEYYKRIEEFKRIYDPTPENPLRVRADASPDYQKMTYRERANFDVNRLLSMSKTVKGSAFEEYVSRLLRGMGYSNVKLTRTTGDYGADIVAEDESAVFAFQCKCYQNSVGIDAVYQVLGGASYYNANKLIVVTTGYFTGQAKELAERSSVKLIDRNQLINIIEKYYSELAMNRTISKGF